MANIGLLLTTSALVRWIVYGTFTFETLSLFLLAFTLNVIVGVLTSASLCRLVWAGICSLFWTMTLVWLIRRTGDLGGEPESPSGYRIAGISSHPKRPQRALTYPGTLFNKPREFRFGSQPEPLRVRIVRLLRTRII